MIENEVLSLAEAVPGDKYDFAPSDGTFEGVRTFGDQVKHLATIIYMTAALGLEERSPYGPRTHNNGTDGVKPEEEDGEDRPWLVVHDLARTHGPIYRQLRWTRFAGLFNWCKGSSRLKATVLSKVGVGPISAFGRRSILVSEALLSSGGGGGETL